MADFGNNRLGGDLSFLAKKSFDGKIRHDEGNLVATGDLATLTANSGKEMYLVRAKVTWYPSPFTAGDISTCVLKMNGTTVETSRFSYGSSSSANALVYEFKNMGLKVLAGQIIKLEVTGIDTDSNIAGFIECIEETTGVDPSIG